MTVVTARNIMSKKVIYVEKEDSFKKVVSLMQKHKISSVMVGKYGTGIVTERDLIRKALPNCLTEDIRAKHIMSKPVISVDGETPVEEVVKIMEINNIRHLIVKDSKGVRGVITETDIVQHSKRIVEITLSYDAVSKVQLFIILVMAVVVVAIIMRGGL